MKDPTLQIRAHYIDLLDISVPVYNMATLSAEPPFVIISTRSQQAVNKTSFDHTVTTTMNIIVKTDGDWGGDKLAEDIANEILPLVTTRPYGQTDDFKIITNTVEASDPISEVTETGRAISKVITIENYVSQL